MNAAVTDPAARRAALAALSPRLVFTVHKEGRVERILEPEVEIGRKRGPKIPIGLDDEGVSFRHARLAFDGASFFVEDLESKNGTHVGEEKLAARSPKEVRCDQRIRLGTLDVLFVHAPLAGESPGPADDYSRAIEALLRERTISAEKARKANQELQSGRHPGEALIVSNAIAVEQWVDAVERARLRRWLDDENGDGGRKLIVGLLAAVVVALVGALIWLLAR